MKIDIMTLYCYYYRGRRMAKNTKTTTCCLALYSIIIIVLRRRRRRRRATGNVIKRLYRVYHGKIVRQSYGYCDWRIIIVARLYCIVIVGPSEGRGRRGFAILVGVETKKDAVFGFHAKCGCC